MTNWLCLRTKQNAVMSTNDFTTTRIRQPLQRRAGFNNATTWYQYSCISMTPNAFLKCARLLVIPIVIGCSLKPSSYAIEEREDRPPPYTIIGGLNYELQLPNGNKTVLERSFQVSVSNCTWQAIINLKEHGNMTLITTFDSKNLIYYGPTNAGAMTGAVVEASPVPFDWAASGIQYIWMAYASACYYTSSTNRESYAFSAIIGPSGQRFRYKEPANWELSAVEPHLPTKVEFTKLGMWYVTPDGRLQFKRYEPPFVDGFIEGRYIAESFTNVQTLVFPKVFDYSGFVAAHDPGKTDAKCVLTVRGVTTKVAIGSSIEPLPNTMLVQDYRVPEPNVMYVNVGGGIPETNAEAVLQARSKSVVSSPPSPKMQTTSKWGFRAIFVILILLPLVILWSKLRKRPTATNGVG